MKVTFVRWVGQRSNPLNSGLYLAKQEYGKIKLHYHNQETVPTAYAIDRFLSNSTFCQPSMTLGRWRFTLAS